MKRSDQALVDSLIIVLQRSKGGAERIRELERLVGESRWEHRGDNLGPLLENLTVDLAYYVADPKRRLEDRSYYGDERLEQIIRAALQWFRDSGVAIPGSVA